MATVKPEPSNGGTGRRRGRLTSGARLREGGR
jgi:hypothetical protein